MASYPKEEIRKDQENWQEAAIQEQTQFAEFLKTVDMCTLPILRDRLAVALFGIPEKLDKRYDILSYEHYNMKQKEIVENISATILKNQKNPNKQRILLSFVLIIGRLEGTKKTNFEDWVFRVPGSGSEKIFIDRGCRVYANWKNYLTENTLPRAKICYPRNGEYTYEKQILQVEFTETPSCSVKTKVLFGLDVTSAALGIAAGAVTTMCLFVPIAAPLVWTALATSALSGSYGVGRSIEQLVDRDRHSQTLSFLDSQARSAWLGATIPIFGMAAGGASVFAARAPAAGFQVSEAAKTLVNVTNGVNCVAHGVSFAHEIYGIAELKFNDCVTYTQVLKCVASALLFANAVISTHQARMLLQAIPQENGRFENPLKQLSQSTFIDGVNVRPTNVAIYSNIVTGVSMVSRWGELILSIPPDVCTSVYEIIQFIAKSMKNGKMDFVILTITLLPKLKDLWEKVTHFVQNHDVFHQFEKKYAPENTTFAQSHQKETFPMNTNQNCMFSYNFDEPGTSNTNYKTKDFHSGKVNLNGANMNEAHKNHNKITILDMEWTEQKTEIQKAVTKVLETENMSVLEILELTRLFLERLKNEVGKKEEEFQRTLQHIPNMSEENLEIVYGIEGNRTQFFANKVMESYRDFKLLKIKQDYQRLLEEEGMQLPLYCPPESNIQIRCYMSTQKEGTRKEKYFKILKQASVSFDPSSSIVYYCENSCFVEFEDPNSDYIMVGIVNFTEGNNMSGIIILQKRTC